MNAYLLKNKLTPQDVGIKIESMGHFENLKRNNTYRSKMDKQSVLKKLQISLHCCEEKSIQSQQFFEV